MQEDATEVADDTGAADRPDSAPMEFGAYYYRHDCGIPYERNEHWLTFFRKIAERVVTDLAPESVLDAGCAWGFLVEAFHNLDVPAWGVDVSEFAISRVHESVSDRCWVASLTEPLPRRYDLVTVFEVLEHMPPADGEAALDNLCAATDRILFSSTPFDYSEPTHVNLQPPESWTASFARRGFFRNLDYDASFLTSWAVLYERSAPRTDELVRAYDRSWWRLHYQVHEMREALLEMQRRLERHPDSTAIEALEQELLVGRDAAAAGEARAAEALGRVRVLETEVLRLEAALDEIVHSRAWRLAAPLRRLRARARKLG
jgi:hypothetical protein